MINSLKNNKGVIVLLAVVIAFFAWFALSEKQPAAGLLTTEGVSGTSTDAERELLRLLLDMRSIRLDGSLFEKPSFLYVKDFGKEIVPEPVGRKNPFAPIGEDFIEVLDASTTDEFILGGDVDIEGI